MTYPVPHSCSRCRLRRVPLGLQYLCSLPSSHFAGPIGPGSSYEIDVPAVWNGDFVLYAHGIVQAEQPVVPPTEPGRIQPVAGGPPQRRLRCGGLELLQQRMGALYDAVRRTHQLSGIFKSKAGHPRRIFLVGHSMKGRSPS